MPTSRISESVASILKAFCNGLDVVRYLGNDKKQKKTGIDLDVKSVEGSRKRLEKVLEDGTVAVQNEYEKGLRNSGQQFGVGDAAAQASLTRTLLQLNSGLIGINSGFLERQNYRAGPDYAALTRTAEECRNDAVWTLLELSRRTSCTQLPLRVGTPTHDTMQRRQEIRKPDRPPLAIATSSTMKSKRAPELRAEKVHVLSSHQPQLALVRPRVPLQSNKSRRAKREGSSPSARPDSVDVALASTAVYVNSHSSGPADTRQRTRKLPRTQRGKTGARLDQTQLGSAPMPAGDHTVGFANSHLAGHARVGDAKRSRDQWMAAIPARPRDSVATNSTNIGEIPLHEWAMPFDFDEMSRINYDAERKASYLPADAEQKTTGFRLRVPNIFSRSGQGR